MKKIVMSLVILASANSAHAIAVGGAAVGSFLGFSASVGLTLSHEGWNKTIVYAKDDAQLFVASQGQIRGSQFEQAVKMIRENKPNLAAMSDEQLALEILNY